MKNNSTTGLVTQWRIRVIIEFNIQYNNKTTPTTKPLEKEIEPYHINNVFSYCVLDWLCPCGQSGSGLLVRCTLIHIVVPLRSGPGLLDSEVLCLNTSL